MGCGSSGPKHEYLVDETRPGMGKQTQIDFDKLRINKVTVDKYYDLFLQIDKDGSGEIDLDEFYRFFDIDRSPFSDRIFSIMDEDGSGEIDFREFVLCLWNYLSFDTHSLVKFAFTLFDLDGSGCLDVTEVRELVMEVYGDAYEATGRVHRILDRIDEDGDGEVSYSEFKEFNRKYPAILFPAFRMQQELRRRVFGEKYWESQLKERAKLGGGQAASIWEILNAMDAEAYAKKMEEMLADEAAKRWVPEGMEEHYGDARDAFSKSKARREKERKSSKSDGSGGGGGGGGDGGSSSKSRKDKKSRSRKNSSSVAPEQRGPSEAPSGVDDYRGRRGSTAANARKMRQKEDARRAGGVQFAD